MLSYVVMVENHDESNFVNITAPDALYTWLEKHGYNDLDDAQKVYSYGPKRWEFETVDVYKFANCAVVVENLHKEGFEDIDQAFGYAAERGERSRQINRCFGQ